MASMSHGVGRVFERRARARAIKNQLPGTYTCHDNAEKWRAYDWSAGGEEWTISPEWRRSVVEDLMLPRLPDNAVVLEIGAGAGRWSAVLVSVARELILTDISERAIAFCRARFVNEANVRFCVTDAGLPEIGDGAVDFVWSFDVFVHIAPVDQEAYMREIARVMRPGGRGVIHHAGRVSTSAGWRSAMTAELFAEIVRKAGMRVTDQFDRTVPGLEFTTALDGDVVTVFQRDCGPVASGSPRSLMNESTPSSTGTDLRVAIGLASGRSQ